MSQQINLLRPKDRSRQAAIASLAAVGVALVALLGYHQVLRMETARLSDTAGVADQRLANVRNLIQALQKSKSAQGDAGMELTAEIAALKPRADALGQLVNDVKNGSLGSPAGFARYYDTLAGVSMEGLWITSINVAKGGTVVSIGGRALRSESVMQYAGRLNEAFLPFGVRFNSLELTPEAAINPNAPAGTPALSVVAFKIS